METIVIFANGEMTDRAAARRVVPSGARLIAADGGSRHCAVLGLTPDVLIGDLDSTPPEEVARLSALGAEIRRYPADKDETDLELALARALEFNPDRILVLGALGGRLDQTLGNLALLAAPHLAALDVRADDGLQEAFFIRRQAEIFGQPGETVSLLPWGGDVHGATTSGLRWPLRGETLYAHRTRGISNQLIAPQAQVRLTSGLLLCLHTRSVVAQNEA